MSLGFDKILERLEAYGDNYCAAIENEADHEGKKHYDEALSEAIKENEARYQRYIEEAAQEKKREIARFDAKSRQEVGELKLKCIDEILGEVLAYFLNLTDKEFVDLVSMALNKHNGRIKPRIHVDPKHYDAVLKEMGSKVQVIEDTKISNGFTLDFKSYDVNYEFEKVFVFNRGKFVQSAMQYLFEE